MTTLPAWLNQDVWACHTPTTIVFQPKKCIQDERTMAWLLFDCNEQPYLLSECDQLDPSTHLSTGAGLLVIGSKCVPVRFRDGVLLIGNGNGKKLGVRLGHVGERKEELLESAKHLANFFGGTLFEYPEYAESNHFPKTS